MGMRGYRFFTPEQFQFARDTWGEEFALWPDDAGSFVAPEGPAVVRVDLGGGKAGEVRMVNEAELRESSEDWKNAKTRAMLDTVVGAPREAWAGVPCPSPPVCLSVPLIDAPGELRFMAALAKLAEEFRSIPGSPTQPGDGLPPDEFERAIQWFASKYAPERPF